MGKKNSLLLLLGLTLLLTACVRPGAETLAPTATLTDPTALMVSPTVFAPPTLPSSPTPTEPPATPTETEYVRPTSYIITPTVTGTITPLVEETSSAPPTAVPLPSDTPVFDPGTAPIDPDSLFPGKRYVETFDTADSWRDYYGNLPDNEYFKMTLDAGVAYITAKYYEWDTWWIGGHTLTDFYIEMDVNSGECTGNDAYGMILRAHQSGQPSRGYLVALTCDGRAYLKRLDSVDPYYADTILMPTPTPLIHAGANQDNTLGVHMEGEKITIYINRYYFTVLIDNTYLWGRFGIYAKAGPVENYTFAVSEMRVWDMGEE